MDPLLETQLTALLQDGRGEEAVALYQSRLGVSQFRAKCAIISMAMGAAGQATGVQGSSSMDPGLQAGVLELIRQNRKLEAVRLYKNSTGESLQISKNVVDHLEALSYEGAQGRPYGSSLAGPARTMQGPEYSPAQQRYWSGLVALFLRAILVLLVGVGVYALVMLYWRR